MKNHKEDIMMIIILIGLIFMGLAIIGSSFTKISNHIEKSVLDRYNVLHLYEE